MSEKEQRKIRKLDDRVKRLFNCPFSELSWFQGNLVEMIDRRAKKLEISLKKCLIDSFKVWCAPDGKTYILDGHQRYKILETNEYSGAISCIEIECKDKKEAAEFVLKYRSSYGRTTNDGLHEFLETNALDWQAIKEETDFLEINMDAFEAEFYKDIEIQEKEIDELEIKNRCPKCGFEW